MLEPVDPLLEPFDDARSPDFEPFADGDDFTAAYDLSGRASTDAHEPKGSKRVGIFLSRRIEDARTARIEYRVEPRARVEVARGDPFDRDGFRSPVGGVEDAGIIDGSVRK